MLRILSIFIVAAQLAIAGQSLASGQVGFNLPNRSKSLPYRIEYMIHGWNNPCQYCRIFRSDGLGFDSLFDGPNVRVNFRWLASELEFFVPLASLPDKLLNLRFQFDPVAKKYSLEVWDANGKRVFFESREYPALNTGFNDNGADATATAPIAFVRVHSTLVPLNSRPPVHFDPLNRILEWSFNGSLSDASGSGNGAQVIGGTPSYVATVGQIAFSLPQANPTSWSNWTSLRAGHPQKLQGSASYSQADSSSSVSYLWRLVSGPSRVQFSAVNVAAPTITGLIFGTYVFELKVTDASNSVATQQLEVGAVATDNNGVVIPADPAVTKIFGPMIAFGKNPWGHADDTHLRGSIIRSAHYDTIPPEWAQLLPGTVSYSTVAGTPNAILSASIGTTNTSFTVNSLTGLDLSTLPAIVSLGIPGYGGEEVLVCSVSGTTLSLCFDGRGYGNFGATQNWASGTWIIQRKATGVGTRFLTDFCPAGVGLAGSVIYSAGTVSVTSNSTALAGTGTSWNAANDVFSGYQIRISGTQGNGIPFVFHAYISVTSPTSITLSRPWPAAADTASGLSYRIIKTGIGSFTPQYDRVGAPAGFETGQQALGATACLSDTVMYFNKGREQISGTYTNKQYARTTRAWMSGGGNGTPNFYDEVLANYALYFRSGWEPARTAARKIGDYWMSNPEIDDGFNGSFPRNMSVTGVVASTVLDGRTRNWFGLRNLAAIGVAVAGFNCEQDTREHAYQTSWLALAGLFDPLDTGSPTTPGQRSYWKAKLEENYVRDYSCRGADFSFPQSDSFFSANPPALSVTAGSTAVTGSGFSPSMCPRVAGGSGIITTGSSILTATTPIPAGDFIVITGKLLGQPYTRKYLYTRSGTSVQLSIQWAGDSGTVQWQVEPDTNTTTISPASGVDPDFGKVYACTYNSPTSLTLDHPWEGSTRNNVFLYRGVLVGKGQQPFVLGIKTLQMNYASLALDNATGANYRALAVDAAKWILTKGFDPVTGGLFYGRGMTMCEPDLVEAGPNFGYRAMECSYTSGSSGKGNARALLAEAQNAVRLVYEAESTPSNRALGDLFYANQWGVRGLTSFTVPLAEGNIFNQYSTDSNLNVGKWYGFQFGVGMAHQWPAVRLGGASAPQMEEISLGHALSSVEGAVTASIQLTAPSGAVTETACTADICQVSLDRRQGAYWYVIRYADATAKIRSESDPELLSLP